VKLSQNDYKCLFQTLGYNRWFTSIVINSKLEKEALNYLADAFRNNDTLEVVNLRKAGITRDVCSLIRAVFVSNPELILKSIDLSHNRLEVCTYVTEDLTCIGQRSYSFC
jgi:hypothetical protein